MKKQFHYFCSLLFILGVSAPFTMVGMVSADIYRNYAHLSSYEKEGKDYRIEVTEQPSDTLILAIHGGRIEPGSTEIAREIAVGGEYNYYSFIGQKNGCNNFTRLHVTSNNFDEPRAINMATQATRIVSIHGCGNSPKVYKVYVGGYDKVLGERIMKHLIDAGFSAEWAPVSLNGKTPYNICNKGKTKQGVQLEISWGIRKQFFYKNQMAKKRFAKAIRDAIEEE